MTSKYNKLQLSQQSLPQQSQRPARTVYSFHLCMITVVYHSIHRLFILHPLSRLS